MALKPAARAAAQRTGLTKGDLQAQTESRVAAIAATLRAGTYRNGVTLETLGAQWGIGIDRMHELSALASKRVRAEVTDPDHVAARGFAGIAKIAEDAMASVDDDPENAATHRSVALKAFDTWITKSGVAAPTKPVAGSAGDLSALTDEQLETREREILARMRVAQRGGQ